MGEWLHNKRAQIMPKVFELVGACCVVRSKEFGEQHGVIESISAPVLGDDLEQSINASKFKIRVQSGIILTIPGSEISAIGGQPRKPL